MRKEVAEKFVKEELVPYFKRRGFIKPDFEHIGKVLCEMYEGEQENFEKLMEDVKSTREEAEKFLTSLK